MTRNLNIRMTGYTSADCLNTFTAEGIDPDTGLVTPIDLTDVNITFVAKDACASRQWVGTVDSGITVEDPTTGEFTVWIPVSQMAQFRPGEYQIGCTLEDIVTVQFLLGSLLVLDGVV